MPDEEMEIKIRKISDFRELDRIDEQWNFLVDKSTNIPFLLSEFVKQDMKYVPRNWNPFVLIISKGKKIIGIAPLKFRFSFFDRRVDFLKQYYCSDFVFIDEYRDMCIKLTLEFLFEKLRCNIVQFVFPHDSPNLSSLDRYCKQRKIRFKSYLEKGRRIIPISSTWSKYVKLRPGVFRKNMKRAIHLLNNSGSWKLIDIEGTSQTEVSKKIFKVEKNSWKETWRTKRGFKDFSLQIIINSLQKLSSQIKNLKLRTWFLEFNGKTIAYVLCIIYKDITILTKTSYDDQYRKLSPGIATQLLAVKQLYEEKQSKYVDFLSDLPYMRYWTKTCFPRIGVTLSKGILPTLFVRLKQKLMFSVHSSPFLMKKVDVHQSEGCFSEILNVVRKKFS